MRKVQSIVWKRYLPMIPIKSLRKYDGPKLIIATINVEKQLTLHKLNPAVPFKSIDKSWHWSQLDQPEEFIAIVEEFIHEIQPLIFKILV